MNHKIGFRNVACSLAIVAAGMLVVPASSHAETRGMERRDDRGQARDSRQDGRQEGREAKQDCRGDGGNGVECRGEKHEAKQDGREEARDTKYDGPE